MGTTFSLQTPPKKQQTTNTSQKTSRNKQQKTHKKCAFPGRATNKNQPTKTHGVESDPGEHEALEVHRPPKQKGGPLLSMGNPGLLNRGPLFHGFMKNPYKLGKIPL